MLEKMKKLKEEAKKVGNGIVAHQDEILAVAIIAGGMLVFHAIGYNSGYKAGLKVLPDHVDADILETLTGKILVLNGRVYNPAK